MFSDLAIRIVAFEHDRNERQPIPELADIWERIEQVICSQVRINNSEDQFREQQAEILRNSCLIMPSPFLDGTDISVTSYYQLQRFFYAFHSHENYFWITVVPEHAPAAVYFPHRKLVACLYPFVIDPYHLAQFERLRAEVVKEALPGRSQSRDCALVLGHPHFMHMLWNHLPALEGAVQEGLVQGLPVAMTHEPFGPTAEIFPELAATLSQLPYARVPDLNRQHDLLIGLGSSTITPSLQARVKSAALRYVGQATLADLKQFRSVHSPIFWMSVKPPDRTCHNQVDVVAAIVEKIKDSYPHAGILLNGVSRPWDLDTNENYVGFYRNYIDQQASLAKQLINGIVGRLDRMVCESVRVVSDVSVCDEIAWSEIADFYFCHGGTQQHKIGWIQDIPGIIYSNSKFIEHYKQIVPFKHPVPVYYLPATLVADEPDTNYTPEKLARKDQNFTLLSPTEVAAWVLDTYRLSRQPQDQPQ